MSFPRLTADEAAALIQHGQTVGFSGFTPAGAAKAIPLAIASRAKVEHSADRDYQIGVLTGASTGKSLDGALAEANAISFRTPYQSDPGLRSQINSGQTRFVDMHLSLLPQVVRYGYLGPVHWAVVEACDITRGGGVVLTTSVGAAPTFMNKAEKVLIELNRRQPPTLLGMHDIYEPQDPPLRREIPIYSVSDRIGSPIVALEPSKIAGVVETDLPDECGGFSAPTPALKKIGEHVARFLVDEMRAGKIPAGFLPLQSGVGDIANSVLAALGADPAIPAFDMYTEVLQDAVVDLLKSERCRFTSTCALTVSPQALAEIHANPSFFRSRILMRPQEITNHPEVVRRLGVISMNTAIEVDLFGNVNSTHVMGRQLMNGIGGSGDFTRNAYLSIFSCPSTAKGDHISTIVPLVTHMDHSEHSVQVVITEQGIADLRGLDPHQRARTIIKNCAHPEFRDQLTAYLDYVRQGHTPQSLSLAFAMHRQFDRTGDMRGIVWADWRR